MAVEAYPPAHTAWHSLRLCALAWEPRGRTGERGPSRPESAVRPGDLPVLLSPPCSGCFCP